MVRSILSLIILFSSNFLEISASKFLSSGIKSRVSFTAQTASSPASRKIAYSTPFPFDNYSHIDMISMIKAFSGVEALKVICTERWMPVYENGQEFRVVHVETPQGLRSVEMQFTHYDYWDHFAWGSPMAKIALAVPSYQFYPTTQINFIRGKSLSFSGTSVPPTTRTLSFLPSGTPAFPTLIESVHQVRLLPNLMEQKHFRLKPSSAKWLKDLLNWDFSESLSTQKPLDISESAAIAACNAIEVSKLKGYSFSTSAQFTGLSPEELKKLISTVHP